MVTISSQDACDAGHRAESSGKSAISVRLPISKDALCYHLKSQKWLLYPVALLLGAITLHTMEVKRNQLGNKFSSDPFTQPLECAPPAKKKNYSFVTA